jgi:hypothetical protein
MLRWTLFLAQRAREPRSLKVRPSIARRNCNQEQETARRRAFTARHGSAMGGGKLWEHGG